MNSTSPLTPPQERFGDWMACSTGRKWYLLDPHPDDVAIGDIAHGLSMICRFGGHCREFFSVAQHCVIIAEELIKQEAGPQAAMWGLLHDAPEAYLGDMIRPLKREMTRYRTIEHLTEACVLAGLGIPQIPEDVRSLVKGFDMRALMTERRDLMNHCDIEWTPRAIPFERTIVPLGPLEARVRFLYLFEELREQLPKEMGVMG